MTTARGLLQEARYYVQRMNDDCCRPCDEDSSKCCADTLRRIDAFLAQPEPAAPAPEPVAWALQHKHGLAFEFVGFIQPTREKAEEMQRRHFGNPAVVPLYTHPVPVAAPAPDVDKIMALVSQVIGPMLQAELRSEVERLAQRAERAELDAAIGAALQDKTT